MRIAPEGRPFVGATLTLLAAMLALAAVQGSWWWALVLAWLPVTVWIPWFFRDPTRAGPRDECLILAPADGRVVAIVDEPEPEFLGGSGTRVSVFMSVFDVHVNRYPVSGTVRHRRYRPGAFINAARDQASERNEQMTIGLESVRGRVLVRQIAGLIARRIVTDHDVGAPAAQGERMGMIRFGSRLDTVIPPGTRIRVHLGERAHAGVTVLAEWT